MMLTTVLPAIVNEPALPDAMLPRVARSLTPPHADLLAKAVSFAILAPSSHNTQPWKFTIGWDGLEITLDRSRVLPNVDPAAREMIMSCGAALQNIRIALRHCGFATKVELMPHASSPDVLARVRVGGPRVQSKLNDLLFDAIGERHTNRAPFLTEPVEPRLIAAMRSAAQLEGAWLDEATEPKIRSAIANLVADADRWQWMDRALRQELASWMRPNTSRARDGLPGYVFGMSNLVARFAPAVMRRIPLGATQAKHDRELTLEAPLLVTLCTAGDMPRDWIEAGQALQLVLLVAAAHGISASFLNQPLQVPALRARVRAALGLCGHPQVILRMGYGQALVAAPRRDVSEVLNTVARFW